MNDEKIRLHAGYILARAITRKHAKSFYFGSLFLSNEIRNAAYSIYALCRITDDLIDTKQEFSKLEALEKVKDKINCAYDNRIIYDDLLYTFKYTITTYKIPKKYFDYLIEGMSMDININRYNDFDQLYRYCYCVAGVIGLIMLKIFGFYNNIAKVYAVDLGIAMQLTNIVRDIFEDYKRGRIYIPLNEMQKFGVNYQHFEKKIVDENFINLLKFQIKRSKRFYANSQIGIKFIINLRARFAIFCMKTIYCSILDRIEKNNFDIFNKRAQVPLIQKIRITLKILIQGNYLKNKRNFYENKSC